MESIRHNQETYSVLSPDGRKSVINIEKDAPLEAKESALHYLTRKNIDYTCLKCKSRQIQNKKHAWCDECIAKP